MGDIVNLRSARKKKERTEREKRAAENRAAFGRTRAEVIRDETEAARLRHHLDQHRREDDTP